MYHAAGRLLRSFESGQPTVRRALTPIGHVPLGTRPSWLRLARMPQRRPFLFHGSLLASSIVLSVGVNACAASTASPRFTVERPGNAISVWGGAFRINGGATWKLERVSGDARAFNATYRAGALQCHITVTNAPAAERNAEQLNAETLERTRAERKRLASTARHLSDLSERRTGTALVLVWDWQDAKGRYHVRNQAALQPKVGGRTVLAEKACESTEPLDALSAAVQSLRAEFDFQSPYWEPGPRGS